MPKHYKDMIDELINKIDEDVPANNTGGTDMNPTGAKMSPKTLRRKKEQGDEQEKISKKIGNMVKENNDNNSILLKQVLDALDKVDTKIDEQVYGKTEIVVEEKKEYKTFKDKYNG